MGSSQHLDVNKALQNFLKNIESLSCLPLITDAEMDRLFGEDVKSALIKLDFFNQQEKLCKVCDSRCCQLVKCELYTTKFRQCPIHERRPVLCRMHFCQKFSLVYPVLVKELGDIFLECVIAAERVDSKKAHLFDSPSFKNCAPDLIESIVPLIKSFTNGSIDEESALLKIENYLSS